MKNLNLLQKNSIIYLVKKHNCRIIQTLHLKIVHHFVDVREINIYIATPMYKISKFSKFMKF